MSTKTITVRYFASIREHLGVSSESVQTDALTLGALREELQALDNLHAEGLARSLPREFFVPRALICALIDRAAICCDEFLDGFFFSASDAADQF